MRDSAVALLLEETLAEKEKQSQENRRIENNCGI
jgi:hypothetical protein